MSLNLKRSNILFYLKFAKRNWHEYLIPIILMGITPFLIVYSASLIEQSIELGIKQANYLVLIEKTYLFFICSLLAYIFQSIQTVKLQHAGLKTLFFIRQKTLQHICHMRKENFQSIAKGTLIARVSSDVERIGEAFLQGLADMITDFITIIVILVYIFYYDVTWGLVTLLFMPLIYITINRFRRGLKLIFRRITTLNGEMSAHINSSFTMLNEIKSFHLEDFYIKKFSSKNKKFRLFSTRLVYYESLLYSIFDALLGFIIGIFFIFISYRLTGNFSLGFLASYIILLQRLLEPIRELSGRIAVIQGALGSLDKIKKIFSYPLRPTNGEEQPQRNDIVFDNVFFGYSTTNDVLKNISFHIKENDFCAIVGPTGTGKSTIIELLLNNYFPQKGKILIGGKNIKECSKEFLKKNIALVEQNPYFFHGSLYNNLIIGNKSLTKKDIDQVCKEAGFYDFIHNFPNTYNFIIEENANNLSEGEKQILAIIRALLRNSNIIIFDEASANIDTKSEKIIQDNLEKIIAKKNNYYYCTSTFNNQKS